MRVSVPTLLIAALILPAAAPAQTTTWFRAALGVDQAAQKSPAESPYVYEGWSTTSWLEIGRDRPKSVTDYRLMLSIGGLSSGVTGGKADHGTGSISVRYLRSLTDTWSAGVEARALVDFTNHHYASPNGTTDQFGYFVTGLAPAIRATRMVRHARLTNDLSVPLIDWIDSPYSNGRASEPRLVLKFASPASLIAFDDALSYCIACESSRSVSWTYRLSYLGYSDLDTRRFVRQSLSMTANMPFRRRP